MTYKTTQNDIINELMNETSFHYKRNRPVQFIAYATIWPVGLVDLSARVNYNTAALMDRRETLWNKHTRRYWPKSGGKEALQQPKSGVPTTRTINIPVQQRPCCQNTASHTPQVPGLFSLRRPTARERCGIVPVQGQCQDLVGSSRSERTSSVPVRTSIT